MSPSAPSESSTLDATLVAGADLVEFDRRDQPIYQVSEAPLLETGDGTMSYGASLDRVFGKPGDVHLDGIGLDSTGLDSTGLNSIGLDGTLLTVPEQADALVAVLAEDPLVALGALPDSTAGAPSDTAVPELATVFDLGIDAAPPAHDGAGWDWAGADGIFDFQT